MLPLEPTDRAPPTRSRSSAQMRQSRAMAVPQRARSSDSLLPFEPVISRSPLRKNQPSAAERCRRAMALSPTALDNAEKRTLDAPVTVSHDLFDRKLYEPALEYYQNILKELNYHHLSLDDLNAYVDTAYRAAKCCYYLHCYDQEYIFCQLALDRIVAYHETHHATISDNHEASFSLGEAMIQCTLLKAQALGRQRKTPESLQVLRDCRALIHKYTSYRTVKEYMSEHSADQVGFTGGQYRFTKAAVAVIPGL